MGVAPSTFRWYIYDLPLFVDSIFLRLFQHTALEHTPSNLYQQAISRDSFHSWPGGLAWVFDIEVRCNFLGMLFGAHLNLRIWQIPRCGPPSTFKCPGIPMTPMIALSSNVSWWPMCLKKFMLGRLCESQRLQICFPKTEQLWKNIYCFFKAW